MRLPFTTEQFFDLFAAYNQALWPALLALWIASIAACALLFSSRRRRDGWVSVILAVHWAWSALAYHVAFFTRINSAAWLFAGLFLVQSALFLWWGVAQRRLSFAPRRGRWSPVAWSLVAYSLVYPGINAVQHLGLSRIPTFGVPCPTTIFTAGMLMLVVSPRSWPLSIVPAIWSVIGGSAAFLLDVRADYALPIAGVALAVFSLRQGTRSEGHRSVPADGRERAEQRAQAGDSDDREDGRYATRQ
jgi:Family of unknown function (DUF6064)